MSRNHNSGVSLVELMVTLVVFSIIIMAGVPSFSVWIQNSRIRVAAEGMLNGLQTARIEAVRRNTNVQLALSGVGGGWTVSVLPNPPDPGVTVMTRADEEGGTTVLATGADQNGVPATTVTFNGMGWVVPNDDGSPSLSIVAVTSTVISGTEVRDLRVTVGTGGSPKMCDPAVPVGDPRACG